MEKSFLKKFVNNLREELPLLLVNTLVYFQDFFISKHSGSTQNQVSKEILIVRTDLLGDFIVWANAYRLLCQKFRNENFKIVLLGNEAWTKLAERLNIFDKIISINRKKYFKNFSYRKKIIYEVNKSNFEFLLQTSYSRDFAVADSITRNVSSKNKIAFKRNPEAEFGIWNMLSNQWYTKLIQADLNTTFEFYRILQFLNSFGMHLEKYSTTFDNIFRKNDLQDKYFVILPGASAARRCLEPQKFAELIRKISAVTNLKCVICGAPNEVEIGKKIETDLQGITAENKIGKTSLVELGEILANAEFVLGNETGTLHYAAALNVPAICVLGGGHFRKVMPYDEKITSNKFLPLVVYKEMECFNCNWRCKYVTDKNTVVPCISNLTTDYILEKTSAFINEIN